MLSIFNLFKIIFPEFSIVFVFISKINFLSLLTFSYEVFIELLNGSNLPFIYFSKLLQYKRTLDIEEDTLLLSSINSILFICMFFILSSNNE